MEKLNRINLITGWSVFAIAAFVYLSTIEPTASFWDCGERIAAAFKLQIGHPPGAPFFTIIGRVFTLFAGDNLAMVPVMMNAMSALAGAFTILFLFWSITHLAKKIIIPDNNTGNYTLSNILSIMGAGLVGALAYTFSDSFWFVTVEAEAYATSSLFTAMVFWAILKWENIADQKYSNRWLILIDYLIGLSIGVHLLNLLVIPAIVFVYYFKKYPVTKKGIFYAASISVVILFTIMYVMIQGVVKIASWFELIFVNGLGMPFKSGLLIYIVLLGSALIYGIHYTMKYKKVVLNTILLCVTVILIGYSSYTQIVVRSMANPPMDQNNPENFFSLLSFLNREQYGDRPLLKGQYYNAPVREVKEGKPTYAQIDNRYEITTRRPSYVYDERFQTFFPRMYSSESHHVEAYKQWGRVKGNPIRVSTRGEQETLHKPTFIENMRFFFRYQIGHMYIRYFMWNFAGRQNDVQGHGEKLNGNWLSGIKFLDEARLGPQDNLPGSIANNKARNTYYMLPLLLGLIGLLHQWKKHQKDFAIVMLLFFMTGLAIVIYLNQTPLQPRERDYSYVGSFYAFAIWIGLGVIAIIDTVRKKVPGVVSAGLVTVICLLFVPGIMAKENWDDHDRSGRYTARDFAWNYLHSCAPDAIIFTMGDNDTFPLWYIQDVEGVRTDVRVTNLSYLGADWYIRQMQRKVYESDPLPISMGIEKYRQGTRDIVYLVERLENVNLKEAIDFLASDDERTKRVPQYRENIDYFPSKNFRLPINSAKIIETGTVREELAHMIVPSINFSLRKNYATKSEMIVLDILANNDWERPLHYAITVSRENYVGLENYFQLHGLSYRIVPIRQEPEMYGIGSIDTEIMYDNMINKFMWRGVNDPNVYLDQNNLRMLSNFRNNFVRLAEALMDEGKADSARVVLNTAVEVMPHETVPFNYFNVPMAELYYRLNMPEQANELAENMAQIAEEELQYLARFNRRFPNEGDYEKRLNLHILQELTRITREYNQDELNEEIEDIFQRMISLVSISGMR